MPFWFLGGRQPSTAKYNMWDMAKWWGRNKEPLTCSSGQVDQCFIFSLTETDKKKKKKVEQIKLLKKEKKPKKLEKSLQHLLFLTQHNAAAPVYKDSITSDSWK